MKPKVVIVFCVIFVVSIDAATKEAARKKKTENVVKGKRESPTGSYLPPSKSYLPAARPSGSYLPPSQPSRAYLPVSSGISGGNSLGHQEVATYIVASGVDDHGSGYSGGSGRYYSGGLGGGKVSFIGGSGGHGIGGGRFGGQGKLHTIAIPSQGHGTAIGGGGSFGGGHRGYRVLVGGGHGGYGGSLAGGHTGFGSSLGGSHGLASGSLGSGGHSLFSGLGSGGHSLFSGFEGGHGGYSLGHSLGASSLDLGSSGAHSFGGSHGDQALDSSIEEHSLGSAALDSGFSYGGGYGSSFGLGHSLGGGLPLGYSSGGGSLGAGHAVSYANVLSGHSFGAGDSFGKSLGGGSLGTTGAGSISIPSGSYGVPLAPPITSYTSAYSLGGGSHGSGSSGISSGYQTPIYAAGHKGLRHYSSNGASGSSYNVVESKPVALNSGSSALHTKFTSSSSSSKTPFRPSVFLGATHESSDASQGHYGGNVPSQEYGAPAQSYSSSASHDYSGSSQEYEVPSQSYGVPSGHGGSDGYEQVSISGGHGGGVSSGSFGGAGSGGHGPSNSYLPPASPVKGYLPPSTSYGIPTGGSGSYNSIDYSSSSASSHGHH